MNNSANDSALSEQRTVVKKKRHYSLCDCILISTLITYAFAAINFDLYMPESFVKIYTAILLIACACTWMVLSFISGYKKKYGYGVFAVLFWIIPQLIIYLAESGPEFIRMSVIMYALSELSSLINSIPAGYISSLLGITEIIGIFVIILVCAFSFLAGMLVYEARKKR